MNSIFTHIAAFGAGTVTGIMVRPYIDEAKKKRLASKAMEDGLVAMYKAEGIELDKKALKALVKANKAEASAIMAKQAADKILTTPQPEKVNGVFSRIGASFNQVKENVMAPKTVVLTPDQLKEVVKALEAGNVQIIQGQEPGDELKETMEAHDANEGDNG